ncbi:MAG: ABC transporter substrate-binding protein [Stellaceae bacterium]|jgi:branched-chain amino acid transport system substrate-binding protein
MRVINRSLPAVLAAAAFLAMFSAAAAFADPVKIGILLPYSGPFARLGDTMQKAIDLYVKQHGDSVAGNPIVLIKRDTTGPNPDTAKRLAQELITRDQVQILTGLVFTPNALAIAPDITEAKVPTVIMNAATAVITTKSPYFTRTSLTLPQTTEVFAKWAATKGGLKHVYTAVSDYGPGIDAETSFKLAFAASGGTIVDSVRFPLMNPDFAPFLQRVLDKHPQALYAFIPGGSQPVALVKTFHDLGLDKAHIRLLPSEEAADEADEQNLPVFAAGMITAMHYTAQHKSQVNRDFVNAWHDAYGADNDPDFFAVGAYDGMALIYDVVKTLNGKIGGDAAMAAIKGWKHESPRGPILIDPETRDIVQNVYICRVEKAGGGRLVNVEIETYPMVKDPWKERNK